MKTKNKILAVVEIAIVLCSVFLVASPAIAAEQNQEMQKVSANTITTASEDDFVLDIYGNANEDDTIDMRDLTYVKRIFFRKKPETELADAKYDGEINPLDFIQIKLIIVGKEKELTIIDSSQTIVTINKPLKRVFISSYTVETLRSIKVDLKDIMVGATTLDLSFFQEFSDVPQVPSVAGGRIDDTEAVLNLNPDVVIFLNVYPDKRIVYEAAGITTIVFGVNVLETYALAIRMQGYIFDKEDEAEEFIDWYETILNTTNERVKNIPEEKKPKVYSESAWKLYSTYSRRGYIADAGGIDIFAGQEDGSVDPEAVADRNPDIIIKGVTSLVGRWGPEVGGYGVDAGDTADIEKIWEEIMNRPELQGVTAVKEKEVYIMSQHFASGFTRSARPFLQVIYMAKWFQPDVFEDLDPKAIHQEYLTRFQGLDIDLDKKGVFVYHPEVHPDGL
jgi:iron complex transport system substrate-binding protein